MKEIMHTETYNHNGYIHEITVFVDGTLLINVRSIMPDVQVAKLDYLSFEIMEKTAKDSFTLAHRYIGKNPEVLVEKIEEKIYA